MACMAALVLTGSIEREQQGFVERQRAASLARYGVCILA
jgi:hypothetical protein